MMVESYIAIAGIVCLLAILCREWHLRRKRARHMAKRELVYKLSRYRGGLL